MVKPNNVISETNPFKSNEIIISDVSHIDESLSRFQQIIVAHRLSHIEELNHSWRELYFITAVVAGIIVAGITLILYILICDVAV